MSWDYVALEVVKLYFDFSDVFLYRFIQRSYHNLLPGIL